MSQLNSTSTQGAGRMPIGELLVRRGVLTEEDLQCALEHQSSQQHRKLLGEVSGRSRTCQ